MSESIAAVVFDLDGVLVDSSRPQRFAEEYNLEFIEDGDQVIRTEFFERAISREVSRLWV